ncbi:MAG: hypothetical protein ACJAS4_002852 [Bacteriovoracaceae bacterium]|jgi:hypothetical protein
MAYKETKSDAFIKIKNTGLLSPGQLQYLSYLYESGPCTNNELVAKIEEKQPELSRKDLEVLDRHPAELKKLNVIKVVKKKKCSITNKLAQVISVTNKVPVKTIRVSGKIKDVLDGSMNAALLAVEIYNKPRATFKSEAYITLMSMAWLKALHAYYRGTIGDKYYYKKDGKYLKINGEKKTWALQDCINKFPSMKEDVRKNIEFFIPFRNKIEHAHVNSKELDAVIFGECQALLMNYENFLISNFGEKYAINENLCFALQFSQMRTPGQIKAHKSSLAPKIKHLYNYIETYRKGLPSTILESQEYRINVKMVPVNGGASATAVPIEFVKVKAGESIDGEKLVAYIKEKEVIKEVVGRGTLLHGDIYKRVNERLGENALTPHTLNAFNFVFSIKPMSYEEKDLDDTYKEFCERHIRFKQYIYTEAYVDFLYRLVSQGRIDMSEVLRHYKQKKKMKLSQYI